MKKGFQVLLLLLFLIMCASFAAAVSGVRVNAGSENRAKRGLFNRNGETESTEEETTERSYYFRIPLPDGTEEDDITVTEVPLNKRILVEIKGADEDFFISHAFSGDMTGIRDVRYGYSDGISTVELDTDKISFPITEFRQDSFLIRVENLHDVFSAVIALDPGHSGKDTGSAVYGIEEKSITFALAERIRKQLYKNGVYVFLTAEKDSDYSAEKRDAAVRDSRADLLLSLHTGADPNTRITAGVEASCTSGMTECAELLTNKLSASCGQKNLGINGKDISGSYNTEGLPVIRLNLGYITNKGEADKMNSPEYQEKAARAITEAISETIFKGKGDVTKQVGAE